MTKKILIVAGSARQAAQIAYEEKLIPGEWTYVLDSTHLRSYRPIDTVVWFVGTWYQRDFISEILNLTRQRGFETVHKP